MKARDTLLTSALLCSFGTVLGLPPNLHGETTVVNATKRSTTGQGGSFNLANGTPYTWTLNFQHSYQMTGWSFPATIAPFTAPKIYVEFETSCFPCLPIDKSDDGGEATYSFLDSSGRNRSFQVQARAPGGNFQLQVQDLSLGTISGGLQNIGWVHDGSVAFAVGGTGSTFYSTGAPASWMSTAIATYSDIPLGQFVLPGSHDSGMSNLTGGTFGVRDCNVLTQTLPISGQLAAGARYFDVRPVIAGGVFKAGHYSFPGDVSWVGGNGQPLSDIIAEINAFTAGKGKDVIILNLSHDLNTDVGEPNYRDLNQQEYDSLLNQLLGLNYLLTAAQLPSGSDPSTVDLTTIPIGSLNGAQNNSPAVIVVAQPEDSSISLSAYAGQGFFNYSQFNVTNEYSNTEDLDTMTSDQLGKMQTYADLDFLLSWTLTQDATDAVTCINSILDLAAEADDAIYREVLPVFSKSAYPKILYIDDFKDSSMIALAMAINANVLG